MFRTKRIRGTSFWASNDAKRRKELRKVIEIAELLGYEHIRYFSRLFKKITSSSPQDYMRKLNEDIVVNVGTQSVFIPATRYEHQQKLLTSNKKTKLHKNSPA